MSIRIAEIRFEVIYDDAYGWWLKDRRGVPKYVTGSAFPTSEELCKRSIHRFMRAKDLPEEFFVTLNKEELLPLKV